MKKIIITVVIIIIVAVIAVVALAYWKLPRGKVIAYPYGDGPMANMTGNNNENINASSEGEIMDASIPNWKTYKNEAYGFEISYPNDWQVRKYGLNLSDYKNDCLSIYYETNDQEKIIKYAEKLLASVNICKIYVSNLDKYLQDDGYQLNLEDKQEKVFRIRGAGGTWFYPSRTTFSYYPARKFIPVETDGFYYVYIEKGELVYWVSVSWNPREFKESDLADIINTFKFIDN